MNKISYLVTFEITGGVCFGCRRYVVYSTHSTQSAADKSLARLLKKTTQLSGMGQQGDRILTSPLDGQRYKISEWQVQPVVQGGVNQLFRCDY